MKQNYPIIVILFLSLMIGILTLTHYGESWDDLSLQKYAAKSLEAYRTWPQEGVVQITKDDLGNYGPSYVMAIALGSKLLDFILPFRLPDLRHLLYFITYLSGVWAFYALGTRWLAQPAAIGATLLYMSQPLLWGHAFMNPKDTPFLSFFLLSVYFGLRLFDSPTLTSQSESISPANRTLSLLIALWLVSVFSLFFLTETFHAAITSLVHTAQAGETNIISLIASDIHKVDPQIYIQKYFALFIQARAILIFLFTSFLVYSLSRNHPSTFRFLLPALFPAALLGFTTSIRVLGPFAGLIVILYALRAKGKQVFPAIAIYTVISIISMYLTWPYLWADPIAHFIESVKEMSLYPWTGQVLFNGVKYASTELPPSYLPVLLGIQLTEPVWVLFIAGVIVSVIGLREKRQLAGLTVLWFSTPLMGFIILHSALYDNFRQILFILPPVFWMAGVAFEKIKDVKWQVVLMALCIIPGIIGIMRLYPYEYIYYNQFIGGAGSAQGRYELDYWGTSYREAAEYINEIAPANAVVWVEGPSHLFELYARPDLKIYSDHEVERADHYDYVIATTRYDLDKTSFPDAKIIYQITRLGSVLTVIKQP
jgi:hypothetical protein